MKEELRRGAPILVLESGQQMKNVVSVALTIAVTYWVHGGGQAGRFVMLAFKSLLDIGNQNERNML